MLTKLRKLRQLKQVQRAAELLFEARKSNLLLAKSDEYLDQVLPKLAEIIAIEVE